MHWFSVELFLNTNGAGEVSLSVRCPCFRECQSGTVIGMGKGALFREVSSFRGLEERVAFHCKILSHTNYIPTQ